MISIAMATYNGEKYLREQIDSILNQTIQDFELIVCDDCSTDTTWNILQDYQSQDRRIKCYRNEENLGFKKNFEKAIGLCTREYIALSDQDDIWLPRHLEILLNLIGDADIACGNAELINGDGVSTGVLLSENGHLSTIYEKNLMLYRIICFYSPFQGASMLIRRNFLFEKALPMPAGVLYHDAWFAACACLSQGIQYTFNVVTLYRQHGKNASGQKKQWNFVSAVSRTILKFIKKEKFDTDRLHYIDEMRKRFTLSDVQKKILEESYTFLRFCKGELSLSREMECLKWYWKHYKYIYTSKTNKYRLSRTIKLFLTK